MRICARCRMLQEKAKICRFCNSPLQRQLPTKRSMLTGKLAGDDAIRKVSLVGFAALLSAASISLAGVDGGLIPWWSVLLIFWIVPFAPLLFNRKAGRWFLGGLLGAVVALVWPLAAIVVALLLILAPVIAGVPVLDLFADIPVTRLDGVKRSYSTTVGSGLRGTIIAEGERLPSCWELRDRDGLVLVRGSDSSRYDLTVHDGSVELVGPLWIENLGKARPIGVDDAREKLGIPRSYLFPEELYLARRTLRSDEAISVRGELRTEADWVGYRDSAFRRRLVGRAGQPLLVRAT